MSGQVPPTGGEQPNEEELRAYLGQLRQADVGEVVAQTFSMIASAAEVKLGRRDARLLIDAAAAIADAVGEEVDQRLTEQMTSVISQLRVAQVDAEKQLAQMRAEGQLPEEEEGDLPPSAGEPAGAESQPAEQTSPPPQQQGSSAASRLWVPGR